MKVSLLNEKAAILAANYLRAVHTCDVSDAIARELRQNLNQCLVNRTQVWLPGSFSRWREMNNKSCSRSTVSILYFKNELEVEIITPSCMLYL